MQAARRTGFSYTEPFKAVGNVKRGRDDLVPGHNFLMVFSKDKQRQFRNREHYVFLGPSINSRVQDHFTL